MVNQANNSISELLLLSDSLYNANILGRKSAKKLLAFLPAATNPQEPNPRPHTFILRWCLLSGCRFSWVYSLSFLKSQPSSTPACGCFMHFGARHLLGACPSSLPTTCPSSHCLPQASLSLHVTCKALS